MQKEVNNAAMVQGVQAWEGTQGLRGTYRLPAQRARVFLLPATHNCKCVRHSRLVRLPPCGWVASALPLRRCCDALRMHLRGRLWAGW